MTVLNSEWSSVVKLEYLLYAPVMSVSFCVEVGPHDTIKMDTADINMIFLILCVQNYK